MKRNIIYVLLSAALLGLNACDGDFLDRYPKDELSDASFWKTPKDAEMFVADIYREGLGDPSYSPDADNKSDNSVGGIKWAEGNMAKGIYLASDMEWGSYYTVIRKCNVLLEKIEMIENYNQEDKEATIAEARFFRAYEYADLIQNYGAVPYIEGTLSLADMKDIKRTPVAEVYPKIMADLDYAIAKLPEAWSGDKYGRITKAAASSFKAWVALCNEEWTSAAKAAKDVIDGQFGSYELFDKDNTGKYAELFWQANDNCSEAVMIIPRKKDTDVSGGLIGWGCFPTLGWGGINPTQSLVDAFECTDGGTIKQSPLYNSAKPFENRDPRLEVCVLHNGETIYGIDIKTGSGNANKPTGISTHGDATASGYYNQKFLDQTVDPLSEAWNEEKDWMKIRFADVLLMYAEAQNEAAGPDNSVFEAVNRVRRRVGMPELQNTDASKYTYVSSKDEMRERIRRERRAEFAMEGTRWIDIRRWNIAEIVLNQPFLGWDETTQSNFELPARSYEAHNKLWPLPQSEVDLNPSLLPDNPGY